MTVHVYSPVSQIEGEYFLEGSEAGGTVSNDPQKHLICYKRLKSIFFCKICNNSTFVLVFIEHLYKYLQQDMELYEYLQQDMELYDIICGDI